MPCVCRNASQAKRVLNGLLRCGWKNYPSTILFFGTQQQGTKWPIEGAQNIPNILRCRHGTCPAMAQDCRPHNNPSIYVRIGGLAGLMWLWGAGEIRTLYRDVCR